MSSQENSSATTRQRVVITGSVLLLTVLLVLLMGGAMARGASPTPVDLLSADSFAVLAGAGITNAGETTITGDVGSHPTTSQTGFGVCPAINCVNLTGTNQAGNLVTQGAKTDLVTAYNQAASYGRTTIPTELGPSIPNPLVPGVYTSADTKFHITGTLTLDAGGDPDATWIFYMGSDTADGLSTSVGSRVVLEDGAQACNVFWALIGGAQLLGGAGTQTTFVGTIMAGTSITVGDNVTVDGRLLARTGTVTLIHDTITRSDCAAPGPTPTGGGGPTPTGGGGATPTGGGGATPTGGGGATPTGGGGATPTGGGGATPTGGGGATPTGGGGATPTGGPPPTTTLPGPDDIGGDLVGTLLVVLALSGGLLASGWLRRHRLNSRTRV